LSGDFDFSFVIPTRWRSEQGGTCFSADMSKKPNVIPTRDRSAQEGSYFGVAQRL
jgi:hypothetical protein